MEYYLALKKQNNAIFSNMDEPRDHHSEWSGSDKDSIIWYCLYVESSPQNVQINLFMRQK